ncbi:hypothetical protein [Microbacterium arborescens]
MITNDKRGRQGESCKLWARPGSDFCNRHNAPNGGAGPRDAEVMTRRCIARSSRTGSQCKNAPLIGQRTCKFHGATAASGEKAQALLDRMVEPVLWELRDIALNPSTTESDRLRAIQMVLDRTLPRERKVEVTVKPWEIALKGIIREAPEEIVDAEVVEDEADALERHEREEADRRRIAEEEAARDRARAELPQFPIERTRRGSAEPPRGGR